MLWKVQKKEKQGWRGREQGTELDKLHSLLPSEKKFYDTVGNDLHMKRQKRGRFVSG